MIPQKDHQRHDGCSRFKRFHSWLDRATTTGFVRDGLRENRIVHGYTDRCGRWSGSGCYRIGHIGFSPVALAHALKSTLHLLVASIHFAASDYSAVRLAVALGFDDPCAALEATETAFAGASFGFCGGGSGYRGGTGSWGGIGRYRQTIGSSIGDSCGCGFRHGH